MKLRAADIDELHFITNIDNVPTILEYGILSHNEIRRRRLEHCSVADPEVQARRAIKVIPGGRKLHDYANLYLNARNPMMYVLLRSNNHEDLCVIRIDKAVLNLENVVISDENAARGWARFEPLPEGLRMIDREELFSNSWDHTDPYEKQRLKGIMCAEILVPTSVKKDYIRGAYVSSNVGNTSLSSKCSTLPITINSHLFFR